MSVYKAIHGVLSDLSKIGIGKDKTNQQQGFKYRGVDDVMNVVSSLLAKHGLLILPRVTKRECIERQSAKGNALFYTILEVEYDFVGVDDGSKHVIGPFVGEAMDSGDKSSNKAMSIAYKYACFEAFCIPVEAENDPDAEVHEVAHHAPPPIPDADKVLTFGKHKGSTWRDLDYRYLTWLTSECKSPPPGSVQLAQAEIDRRDRESRPPPDEPFDEQLPDSAYRGLPNGGRA